MLNIKPMTREEFYEFVLRPENRDRNFEYIEGELVEVVSNNESSEIAATILIELGGFVRAQKLGRCTGADGGYVVSGADYIPDVAFISFARQPIKPHAVAYNPVAPDLAVEVLSPGNTDYEITRKVANYLAAGTIVWLVNPETQTVGVFTPGEPVKRLRVGEALDGGTLLPGFSLPLIDIFS